MARVDKTESAIGVTRGTLLADIAQADWGKPIGVGINAAGLTVRGAGQSGVVGVIIADKTNYKAGTRCDIFGNGSEIVECVGLVPGTVYFAAAADGVLSTTNTGTRVGWTVEADRLVVTL
jgi:hypothetical protein